MPRVRPVCALPLLLCAWNATAQSLEACRQISERDARLACFDSLAAAQEPAAPRAADAVAIPSTAEISVSPGGALSLNGASLSERWELEPRHKRGTFTIQPYRSVYLLPLRLMSQPNSMPQSANPTNAVASGFGYELDKVEAKFQLSFKTKAWQEMFGSPIDLWFAYSQQSYWQVYNKDISSPFRETNYEPEAFFTYPLAWGGDTLRWRYVNFGLVHQSNGRSNPLSRSWNRVYAAMGFESGELSLQLRPWVRLPEEAATDDNPDIADYAGRGDLVVGYRLGRHQFGVTAHHSLRGGDRNHGGLRLDYSYPISGLLRAHLQFFTGYGESLIDYNQRSTTLGLGVSLVEWK